MYDYFVSACLAGVNCKYNGENNNQPQVKLLVKKGQALPVCPEILAGLAIPRLCCEIKIENGVKKVINERGEELTAKFVKAAEKCVDLVELFQINKAILKSKSPSCGKKYIYDGSFSGNLIKGKGVTAQYLFNKDINIYNENEIDKLNLNF